MWFNTKKCFETAALHAGIEPSIQQTDPPTVETDAFLLRQRDMLEWICAGNLSRFSLVKRLNRWESNPVLSKPTWHTIVTCADLMHQREVSVLETNSYRDDVWVGWGILWVPAGDSFSPMVAKSHTRSQELHSIWDSNTAIENQQTSVMLTLARCCYADRGYWNSRKLDA